MRPARPAAGRVVVLTSGKGGVGKSTLALALADVWRSLLEPEHGPEAVALLDFDPQGGATVAAGVPTAADPLRAAPVAVHGFRLYPGGRALAGATEEDLRSRLQAARGEAALVVVDLSPALTDAAHAVALPVADPLVIVARCDAAGLSNVAEAVAFAAAAARPWRIVPAFRKNTALAREAEAFLRARYGDRVTRATIPEDAKAAEAAGRGRPVTATAPRAKAAAAIRDLVAELDSGLPSAELRTEPLTIADISAPRNS